MDDVLLFEKPNGLLQALHEANVFSEAASVVTSLGFAWVGSSI